MPHPQTKVIFDKLVAEKAAKHYTPYQQTDKASAATGIHCQLLNPVEDDRVAQLIADPAY